MLIFIVWFSRCLTSGVAACINAVITPSWSWFQSFRKLDVSHSTMRFCQGADRVIETCAAIFSIRRMLCSRFQARVIEIEPDQLLQPSGRSFLYRSAQELYLRKCVNFFNPSFYPAKNLNSIEPRLLLCSIISRISMYPLLIARFPGIIRSNQILCLH